MLDTTKPIKLTRSYVDSRGNHYPARDQEYVPGELPEAAWKYQYAVQVETQSENKSETLSISDTSEASISSEVDERIEITNPSTVKEIKPTQENLVASSPKEIKPRTFKHTKVSKVEE